MKEPDRPQEFTRILRETFSEMHTQAQIAPLDLKFPVKVTQSLEAYTKVNDLDSTDLISLAVKAHMDRLDILGEDVCRLMQHPDSFDWPLENPILCVAIAFMRQLTDRWADKVHEKCGLSSDEFEPADWWKTPS